MTLLRAIAFSISFLFFAAGSFADDWPGWMGPQRDNVWRESGILESFPENGPEVLWRVPLAGGYAGPAVANGRVYVTDFVPDSGSVRSNAGGKRPGTERVHCFDVANGEELWSHEYPVIYTISYARGPRATPLVHEGIVYTLGAMGHLKAFKAASGDVIWEKDLKAVYDTTAPIWGFAAHPLIDDDRLITLAGGEGTQVVALNRETGEEIWRALSSPEIGQGYSPPSIIEAGGRRQLIIAKPDAVSGLNPETGEVYWTEPYKGDNGTTIMTPVHVGDYLFLGSFNDRNLLVELDSEKPAAETVWRDKSQSALSAINNQPMADGDIVYGVDQGGETIAFQVPSGERIWETPQPISDRPERNGTSLFVRQGTSDRYWLFTDSGDLVIGRMTPEGFEERDRAHLLAPTNYAFGRDVVWCPPAYADRSMFVRNDQELIRVDLSE